MFSRSERLFLEYPVSTLLETQWQFARRELRVVRTRDLWTEPLTPAEFLSRPLIHRGRWLVNSVDLRTNQFRKFYLASSRQHYRTTGLRLALYWPDEPGRTPAEIISRRFAATRRDRLILSRTLIELRHDDWSGFDLRVTIDRRTA